MQAYGDQLGFSVSHTTRLPRPGEENGVHYHFRRRESMDHMILADEFIESAEVHGNLYGTSVAAVDRVASQGKVCVLDIDVQGLESVRRTGLNPHVVYVAPPSMEALEQRLKGRGTESAESVAKRLENAFTETHHLDKHYAADRIVNDDLQQTFAELKRRMRAFYPHLNEVGRAS